MELDQALEGEFIRLAHALEPEELTCDGELLITMARAKAKHLMKEWAELEEKAGRKVSRDEVWKRAWKRHQN